MRIRHLLAAAVSISLATSAAAAPSAASLSLAAGAGATETGDANELGGRRGGMGWILGIVALGILVFVIVQLQDDNELPGSP